MGPLIFDTQNWKQVQDNVWVNADGDPAIMDFFDLPPDLPAALEDLDALRGRTAAHTASRGGGLVELDVIGLDGLAAVRQIAKLPMPDQQSGVAYIASFIVPRAGCSVVLRVQCVEHGITGMRDSTVFNQFMAERSQRGLPVPELMAEWTRHPYDPGVQGGLPRNAADDPEWDARFPGHPLSRARRAQLALAPTIRFDPRFKELPPFFGPR
ncbi:hypothetical protein [Actinomadura sp. HBU206391]|uniref:hypothetical protein n=1 Tax=Actinomadura sp. HBU206391 TaxID=2731692 RepID=UPI0016508E92|nr:hypothetical protein [Actinomadura sp. HBU206391]MBC6457406.1 hypothetical protein [Actinomadura sp. HBU206391]